MKLKSLLSVALLLNLTQLDVHALEARVAATPKPDPFANVQVKSAPIRGGLHLLTGAGGNIVLSVGTDTSFIVDDQFAPLSEKIRAAAKAISEKEIKFVVNTHWHGDHTGGNENFGNSGAVIIAQDNVRVRMNSEQFNATMKRATPKAASSALPVVTFSEAMSLHLNGTVRVIHVANAHTDGDSLVYFQSDNVLHMGDTYFNGLYPFIDLDSGGGITGALAALKTGLALCDEQTLVVPGHGPISNKQELQNYADMLQGFFDGISKQKAAGATLASVIKSNPTKAFDKTWGGKFISAEALVTAIYKSI